MAMLFSPPFAFSIYIVLVSVLFAIGKMLAGSSSAPADSTLYASGEAPFDDSDNSVPGYRPFFMVALFFAVLHLGVIVLATSNLSGVAAVYLLGLMLVLTTLILG